jgi:hemerythrin HHE cation binding domain-containing protein
MIRVIAASGVPPYPASMATPSVSDLERLAALEQSVSARLQQSSENPAAVLAAGQEVLAFAELEERLFFPVLPLLDPHARAELESEHVQLADDLQLLEHLLSATPDSSDVEVLAGALAKRLRAHIARDSRLIAQAQRLATRATA